MTAVEAPEVARPRRVALEATGVAAIAVAHAAVLLRVWSMPLRLPIDGRSDATMISAMVKTIQESGWYLDQPRLGAPFGQRFADFPHGGETLQLLAMKVLVTIAGDWGLAINLYFLFGFGVLAAVTFLVLRALRFGPVIAGVAALIYTFLPYHFSHGEMHLWRSTYYSVPLACLLLVWTAAWRERFLVDPGRTGRAVWRGNLRKGRVAAALVLAVVIAGSETMATSFTLSLLAAGAVVGAIRWREPVRLAIAAVLIVVIGGTFLLLNAPTLRSAQVDGANTEAGRRQVTESERYGLKLSLMITPAQRHRLDLLGDVGDAAQKDTILPTEGGQALGILGTAGFFGAIYGAVAGPRRRDRPDTRPGWDRTALAEQASTITVLAVLFGMIGGLSVLLATVGFAQVRVWNRIVLFIAFFALVVVCLWAERFAAWVRRRSPRPTAVLAVAAVAVLAFGLWDGIGPVRRNYSAIEARHAGDRAFVGQIQDRMPDGAAVFQLPVLPFPEAEPPGRMLDYDPLRAYLADDGSLRWSYGAIKGRQGAEWQEYLRDRVGPVGALPALLGLGFTGIWVDTYGYRDGGAELRGLERAIGTEPIRSADGRFAFFDLRDYKRRTGMTDAELRAETRRILHVDPPEGTP